MPALKLYFCHPVLLRKIIRKQGGTTVYWVLMTPRNIIFRYNQLQLCCILQFEYNETRNFITFYLVASIQYKLDSTHSTPLLSVHVKKESDRCLRWQDIGDNYLPTNYCVPTTNTLIVAPISFQTRITPISTTISSIWSNDVLVLECLCQHIKNSDCGQ